MPNRRVKQTHSAWGLGESVLKRTLGFFVALGLLWFLTDRLICDRWMYHDYATGSDRRLSCPW
ncbi:MAG: hypothetical protein EBX69_13060 [Betaproteobacteria bacterium]|nr:hypothetical protein [Betaproteobacteria bacterium]